MNVKEAAEKVAAFWEEHIPCHYGCVIYLFDPSASEDNAAAITKNTGPRDALIMIDTVIKMFGLKKEALAKMWLEEE